MRMCNAIPFRTYSPRLLNVKTLHCSSLAVHGMERLKILSTGMTLNTVTKNVYLQYFRFHRVKIIFCQRKYVFIML